MKPLTALGRLLTPLLDAVIAIPCGTGAGGARLGSPPATPGVDDVCTAATEVADESLLDSGSVGFLRQAAHSQRKKERRNWTSQHTLDIAALCLSIFSPPPNRVVHQRHAHTTSHLQLQRVVHLCRSRSRGWSAPKPPHLRKDLSQSLREVVVRYRDPSNRPDCPVKEALAVLQVDMRGKEALAELQEREPSRQHHLVDVVGRVRQHGAN